MLRNLVKSNAVNSFMVDVGRQRCTMFVSRKFEKKNELTQQFQEELEKMKDLTKAIMSSRKKGKKKNVDLEMAPAPTEAEVDLRFTEFVDPDNLASDDEATQAAEREVDKRSLEVASKILRKYKLTKYDRGYKRTFLNLKEQNGFDGLQDAEEEETEVRKSTMFDNIEVSLTAMKPVSTGKTISGFIDELKRNGEQSAPGVSYRLLARANVIIAMVQSQKVVTNLADFMKVGSGVCLSMGRMNKQSRKS